MTFIIDKLLTSYIIEIKFYLYILCILTFLHRDRELNAYC